MIFRRLYDEDLSQAAYLLGCERTRQAIVVDPTLDLAWYVREAEEQRLRIVAVTETHIHADYASGARALARDVGASLLLSAEGGDDWQYAFATADRARPLREGDRIEIGRIRLQVLHTPGHTPEHLTFLVTDTGMGEEPLGTLTGDFVFVGDVGRPDLLERAARRVGTMEASARALHRSLQRFATLPEYLQIWPGHGAGSACGKSLAAMPHSTLGYERRFNWAFNVDSEAAFVARVLEGQPEPPRYFARMKVINRDAQLLAPVAPPRELGVTELPRLLAAGVQIVDVRPETEFATRHATGSINVPVSRAFATYAGSVVDYERPVCLLGPRTASVRAARALGLIGHERIAGTVDTSALDQRDIGTGSLPRLGIEQVERERAAGAELVDVRKLSEWEEGHVPGALHVPLAQLVERLGELPRDRRLIFHCQAGSRGAIAASVLAAAGYSNVASFPGGFAEWARAGRPAERDTSAGIASR